MKLDRLEIKCEPISQGFLKVDKRTVDVYTSTEVIRQTREVCHVGLSVAGLLVDWTNRRVLLIKQYREPIVHYTERFSKDTTWIYEIPAGMVDNKEGEFEALAREFKEETGVVVTEDDIFDEFYYYPSPGYSSECTKLFIISVTSNTNIPEKFSSGLIVEGEVIEPVWIDFKSLQYKWTSGDIRDGKTLLALMASGIIEPAA